MQGCPHTSLNLTVNSLTYAPKTKDPCAVAPRKLSSLQFLGGGHTSGDCTVKLYSHKLVVSTAATSFADEVGGYSRDEEAEEQARSFSRVLHCKLTQLRRRWLPYSSGVQSFDASPWAVRQRQWSRSKKSKFPKENCSGLGGSPGTRYDCVTHWCLCCYVVLLCVLLCFVM
jgi:hypothetical protein